MSGIFEVLAQNILPIFIVALAGYILRRSLGLDKKALSAVVFYALSPALVFSSLVNSQLPGRELAQLAGFTVVAILLMGVVGLLFARLLRLSRTDTVALLIVLMFVNGGNYGLTLNSLRYGSEGLSRAVVYYVVSTILFFTLGVFLASMGRVGWRQSLAKLARLPAAYAVILGIVVYTFAVPVPASLMRAAEVAGAGAIPVMLIVLGMQIADLRRPDGVVLAVPASLLRLLVSPPLAVLVAGWLGLRGIGRATAILEASMPTAVITTIVATEFDAQPALVTSTVVLSTLLSMVTLPVTIIVLGL